jgi:hypothetical protein
MEAIDAAALTAAMLFSPGATSIWRGHCCAPQIAVVPERLQVPGAAALPVVGVSVAASSFSVSAFSSVSRPAI